MPHMVKRRAMTEMIVIMMINARTGTASTGSTRLKIQANYTQTALSS